MIEDGSIVEREKGVELADQEAMVIGFCRCA